MEDALNKRRNLTRALAGMKKTVREELGTLVTAEEVDEILEKDFETRMFLPVTMGLDQLTLSGYKKKSDEDV